VVEINATKQCKRMVDR